MIIIPPAACNCRTGYVLQKNYAMIDLLLDEIRGKLNDYFTLQNPATLYKCVAGDVSMHDKNNEGGEEEILERIILTLISIEEENAMKNNYPLMKVGSNFIKEKSAVYVNIYLLLSAKYATYDTGLKAISQVVSCFQTARKVWFTNDGIQQEAVLNLHNLGFENLNNLWTVLGGRYLPSVIYKARVMMFQQSPPVNGSMITDIREKENV